MVSLSIAVSAAMMRPIMLTSTTSRNSNCPRRKPMQYFCICFRASLSIHSAGWIFPFSTFITSCFSGHNTLLFLVVSGFCGLHDTIWPFKASPQPTFGTEQTPALRAFVAARGSLRPTRFLLLVLSSSEEPQKAPENRLKNPCRGWDSTQPRRSAHSGLQGHTRGFTPGLRRREKLEKFYRTLCQTGGRHLY